MMPLLKYSFNIYVYSIRWCIYIYRYESLVIMEQYAIRIINDILILGGMWNGSEV